MGPLHVRVWPLISSALLVGFNVLLLLGFRGIVTSSYVDDAKLGALSLLSISIMLCSIGFPITAIAGLYVAYRERSKPMKRMKYWYSVLVGVALVAVAVYYGYWGLIGLRLWA